MILKEINLDVWLSRPSVKLTSFNKPINVKIINII